MSPIRVGLIGLSSEPAGLGQGKWGVSAHLASLRPSPHYEIVAVCNSSVESARRSIEFHKLPASVKAYGSAEDLANDPNVELVDVSIEVGKHLLAAKPALLAKKQVFVEWPLGASTAEAEEMLQLAKEGNLKTAVGTQFRADPWLAKVKQLVESGAIGRVTSSDVQISSPLGPIDIWTAEAEYYLDFESGGNEFHIFFAHCKSVPCIFYLCLCLLAPVNSSERFYFCTRRPYEPQVHVRCPEPSGKTSQRQDWRSSQSRKTQNGP